MRAPEQDEVVEEKTTGYAGLAVLAGLLLWLGLRGSWSMVLIVAAIVVIIFLHELGHYLTAKWAGMKVTEFFIGFGPKLWSFQRGETTYGIKGIPAGAYVKIIGMSNLDEVDPADEDRTYRSKPYWRRLSVAVAGSAMHFLLAFLLIFGVLVGYGTIQEDRWSVGAVTDDSPAAGAGLQLGDRIVSVEGERFDTFAEMSNAVRALPGEEVDLVVERDGRDVAVRVELADVNPSTGEEVGFLGVGADYQRSRTNPAAAVPESFGEMWTAGKESILGLGRLFSPSGISQYVDNLTGSDSSIDSPGAEVRPSSPVGIVQAGGQLAERGLINVVLLLFFFNMFIGIFNLTPTLPFDGGHVVIATYEKIRSMISGRRYQADVAKLMPLTYAVVLVLALLFVTSLYLDIANPLDLG